MALTALLEESTEIANAQARGCGSAETGDERTSLDDRTPNTSPAGCLSIVDRMCTYYAARKDRQLDGFDTIALHNMLLLHVDSSWLALPVQSSGKCDNAFATNIC